MAAEGSWPDRRTGLGRTSEEAARSVEADTARQRPSQRPPICSSGSKRPGERPVGQPDELDRVLSDDRAMGTSCGQTGRWLLSPAVVVAAVAGPTTHFDCVELLFHRQDLITQKAFWLVQQVSRRDLNW